MSCSQQRALQAHRITQSACVEHSTTDKSTMHVLQCGDNSDVWRPQDSSRIISWGYWCVWVPSLIWIMSGDVRPYLLFLFCLSSLIKKQIPQASTFSLCYIDSVELSTGPGPTDTNKWAHRYGWWTGRVPAETSGRMHWRPALHTTVKSVQPQLLSTATAIFVSSVIFKWQLKRNTYFDNMTRLPESWAGRDIPVTSVAVSNNFQTYSGQLIFCL